MKFVRRDWILLVVAVIVAAVCARLGIWQLSRLDQRRQHNAATRARLELPPLEITAVNAIAPESVAFRRVHASGSYDYGRERVRPARVYDGAPGVAVLTPLRLTDGRAVFVDRGWAPSADAMHVELGPLRETDAADLVGLGVVLPRGPGDVDPARLADSVPYPLLPFGIQLLPDYGMSVLRRWPAPVLSDGPHKGYALQWFSFGVIALVGTAVLLRQQHRRRTT
jgi:surfeit locus 1 family protein